MRLTLAQAAGLLALAMPMAAAAQTPAPAATPPAASVPAPAATTASPPQTAASAPRAGSQTPPGIAVRASPERRRCREQAAHLRLFGLARHKYLQRCRIIRRKGGEAPLR